MHREVGYMQGMCDLVAPLLVILEDGTSTKACNELADAFNNECWLILASCRERDSIGANDMCNEPPPASSSLSDLSN